MPDDAARDLAAPLPLLPDPLPIPPRTHPFAVTVRPPGSKSLTNRLYVLAALAAGRSRVRRPLRSEDCDRLATALSTLGAEVRFDGADAVIDGVGGRFPRGGSVDLGDGGTPTRFMLAAACLAGAPVTIDGSPRMRERPVGEGVAMLRALGATIGSGASRASGATVSAATAGTDAGADAAVDAAAGGAAHDRLPIRVDAGLTRGGEVHVGRTASSQFVSALLLIAPWLDGGIRLVYDAPPTSWSYIALTCGVLRSVGITVRLDRGAGAGARPTIEVVPPPTPLRGFDRAVEPDASSAVYWLAAAALVPGSRVVVPGLDLEGPQPDVRALRAIAAFGPTIEAIEVDGETGIAVSGTVERGADLDAESWPDGALAIAALAARAPGPSHLRGLWTLRVKETDRIAALAAELTRLGCTVDATDDALHITPAPASAADPVTIGTYDDHRMAMSFGILGLARRGISIADPPCVAKSYPGFWADLQSICQAPPRSR